MLKIRITYDTENQKEKDVLLKNLHKDFRVLQISDEYKGRGKSVYSSIYVDVEVVK